MHGACDLCDHVGGEPLWQDARLRVVAVDDADYPGFCRVIWRAHVREMTDLTPADREALMHMVWRVEAALRATLSPDKINVASLGNMTPHLHWHVIPRWRDDPHFPQPIWAARTQRPAHRIPTDWTARVRAALDDCEEGRSA